MADAVRSELDARLRQLYDAFAADDYDKAVTFYTQTATFLPHKYKTIQGRDAILPVFRSMIPGLRTLRQKETFHCELITADVAYTNSDVVSEDGDGAVRLALRDSVLWRKVEGEWLIDRYMFNSRQ